MRPEGARNECSVQAQLKDGAGHVLAQSDLSVTVLYPKQHSHGG